MTENPFRISHKGSPFVEICPRWFFLCVWNWYKMSFASRERFSSNSHGKVWNSKWPLSIQQTLANQQNPNSSHTAGSSGQNRTRKWRLLRQQSQAFSATIQSTFMMTGVFVEPFLSHPSLIIVCPCNKITHSLLFLKLWQCSFQHYHLDALAQKRNNTQHCC